MLAASQTWPGNLATASLQAARIWSSARARIAAIAPTPTGTASCIYLPRLRTVRTASAKLMLPAATCAEYSPSECPATKLGAIAGFGQHARSGDGNRQNRRLRDLRQPELFVRTLKAERAQRVSQSLVRLFKGLAGNRVIEGEFLAHSGGLRALAGKKKCESGNALCRRWFHEAPCKNSVIWERNRDTTRTPIEHRADALSRRSGEDLQAGCSATRAKPPLPTGSQILNPLGTRPSAGSLDMLLDLLVEAGAGKFSRHPDRILNRIAIGRSVTDNGNAFQPQQRRPAVLGIIQTRLEFLERLAATAEIPSAA